LWPRGRALLVARSRTHVHVHRRLAASARTHTHKYAHTRTCTCTNTHCRYIGMDPVEDRELLYIAEQAIKEPLPRGWKEQRGADGRTAFHNAAAKRTVYEHPMYSHYHKVDCAHPVCVCPHAHLCVR